MAGWDLGTIPSTRSSRWAGEYFAALPAPTTASLGLDPRASLSSAQAANGPRVKPEGAIVVGWDRALFP
ncbi:hypothetical protein GCM10007913_34600 [Devosia yakushimensis]|uniref:Uncharacterized protein n=1 Tax=Devosia yakushimensis TaxID=470028 RepID=A0ABQ5UHI3_9HYPH|nr:hypothetical protein GCM10007913_34600 [Devosia yakushimensis]